MRVNFLIPPENGDVFLRKFGELSCLFLVAAGGDIASAEGNGELTHTMAAIAPGLLVLAAIYFMGAVSGAHLNPAVTLHLRSGGIFRGGACLATCRLS